MPTTSTAGCHSSTSAAIFAHDCGAPAAITPRGRAFAPAMLATASPMRLVPKSKPSATPSVVRRPDRSPTEPTGGLAPAPGSGMARLAGELQRIDAKQSERRRKARPDRRIEDHARIGLHRQPAVLPQLVLQLAGTPARIAERNQQARRAGALCHRFQHLLCGGPAGFLAH